uniref:Uncharacterized protein n=1 Tax=Arundo donax TaxID=35708 RepID=A0A0A9BMB8_ARUDO
MHVLQCNIHSGEFRSSCWEQYSIAFLSYVFKGWKVPITVFN